MDLMAGKVAASCVHEAVPVDTVVLASVDVVHGHGLATEQGREKVGKQLKWTRSMVSGMCGGLLALTSIFS